MQDNGLPKEGKIACACAPTVKCTCTCSSCSSRTQRFVDMAEGTGFAYEVVLPISAQENVTHVYCSPYRR